MSCKDARTALEALQSCTETDFGSRVATHCLYPSFEQVDVFVVRYGDGYRVHDGGGALRVAWLHGRDESLINRAAAKQASKYRIQFKNGVLEVNAANAEWLPSAVLAVANASAAAAHAAVEKMVAATEGLLRDRILSVLSRSAPDTQIRTDAQMLGRSGKHHRFDFVVSAPHRGTLLVDAVAPHHISVAAKYVAFADMPEKLNGAVGKFAVYDRELAPDDVSLLQQVADIVPFPSLERGIQRLLVQ
ncbi:hypothetical protein A7A08_02149 [Methyloligella halotolerans]|uniref:DUF1828 domain-containing protein n=1 Tax=Methyloligella halotolerans TaxID=1177755 RepID=A0A1E2RXH4_9HYPH|nr:hypothetical protein [Methyloligella halotolerans]ODA66852.1 hypothetical protein A7A08_02149 [Methyloligella halotolerans]